MAVRVAVPRQDPSTTDDEIETLGQDRGDGEGNLLVQTSNPMCLTGLSAPATRVSVDDTVGGTQILAENKLRVRAVIRNLSNSSICYVAFDGETPTMALSFPLYPQESYTEITSCGQIKGIADTGESMSIAAVEYKLA